MVLFVLILLKDLILSQLSRFIHLQKNNLIHKIKIEKRSQQLIRFNRSD